MMVQRKSKWNMFQPERNLFPVVCCIAIVFLSLVFSHAKAGWVPGYTYKSKLIIAGSQVCGATSLTNFPVLIQLNGNFLKSAPTGLINNANGYDIIFTANDGTTILNHDIDNYNGTAGSYSAWVQVPSLTPGADLVIYMYYGNSTVTTNPSAQNTWNSNYRTVYHFQNSIFNDATSNAINGTNSGSTSVTAKFGDGRNFDGVDDYIQTSSNDLATANNFTISLWFKADATVPSHLIWEGNNAQNGWGDSAGGAQEMNLSTGTCCPSGAAQNNYLSFFLGDRDQQANASVLSNETSFSNTTTWQYVVATLSNMDTSPSATFYLNGTLISSDAGVAGTFTARNTWDTNLRIGRPGVAARFFDGQIDEVRISNIVRSSDWICTEYNNQNNPNTFASLANHVPILANMEGTTLSFAEDAAATAITATVTASDLDNANATGAVIKVSANYANGEDVLSFTNTGTITGTWNAAAGTLTLTGTDSYANYQAALRAVQYQNINTANPSTSTRTISFTITDGTDNSNTVTRNIGVTRINDAPTAVDDNTSTSQNIPYTGNVLTNDTDAESNTLTLSTTAISLPVYGSVTLNANGSYTYTPRINFVGTDSFVYEVCDNGSPSACSQGTVTITVNGEVAPSGCSGTNPGGGVSTSGLYAEYYTGYFNDDQNYFTSNTPTLVRSTDGPFNYSNDFGGVAAPISGSNPTLFSARYRGSVYIPVTGSYTFYLTSDDAAYLWIDQAALVSPPVMTDALINISGVHSAVMNQATVYLAAGLHNVLIHFGNNNGLAVLKLEYSGPSITKTVVPAGSMCTSVQKTVAANDTYTTGINVALNGTTLLANDFNQDGNALVANTTPVVTPANGSVTINADGTFLYTPNANFVGSDSFTYEVCDTGSPSGCSQAVVFVDVANRIPSFLKGSDVFVNEDSGAKTFSSWATSIDDGDPGITQALTFNASNDNNSLFSVQPAINAAGDLTFTTASDVSGEATVTVTLSDNGSNTAPSINTSASQTFIIKINAVDDPPVALADSYNVDEGGTITIPAGGVLANDTDVENDPLEAVLESTVLNGSLILNADGSFSYVHDGSETIADSFYYHASDGSLNGNTVTVSITVMPVNDMPSASDDSAITDQDTAADINILANDADPDDGIDPGTVVILSGTAHGTLSVNSTSGIVTYTPNAGYHGDDSFTYVVSDNAGDQSGTATVTITITTINGPPVAVNDGPVEHHSVLPLTIDVLANDSDPNNDVLTVVSVGLPSIGSAVIDNNQIIYQPSGTESALITFTYTIRDTDGLTAEASVTIDYSYDPFKVSEGFSPNQDNNNETWYIRNIEAYPSNVVKVFDRWGILVYQAKKYDNNSVVWDGRANTGMQSGNLLDAGTYYYILDLGNGAKPLSGYVEMVR